MRRGLRPALVLATAAAACLAPATPAWADETIPLHEAHKGATAAGFQQECDDERFGERPDDHDGWHFVLPGGKASGDFLSLTLEFTDGSGSSVTVKIPDASDDYVDFLASTGNGQDIHAYVFTPAGWTLADGSAVISGTAEKFNLSHTCAGNGSTEPSPSTSVAPSSDTSESPSTPASPSTSPAGGSLPITGAQTAIIALVGLALLGGGATLLWLRRRRDNVTFVS